MPDDDLYPNNSEFLGGVPAEPLEQRIERKAERAQTLQALPELKKMIVRLQERIEFYEKTTSIDIDANTEEFMITYKTYALMANTLSSEMEYLQGIIDANAKSVV